MGGTIVESSVNLEPDLLIGPYVRTYVQEQSRGVITYIISDLPLKPQHSQDGRILETSRHQVNITPTNLYFNPCVTLASCFDMGDVMRACRFKFCRARSFKSSGSLTA